MVDYVRVPLPSLTGRMGVRSGRPIILSEMVVREAGLTEVEGRAVPGDHPHRGVARSTAY